MTIMVSRPSRQVATSPISRVDPIREFADLQDRLGQLAQTFFGELLPLTGAGRGAAWIVPVDIEETDDAYIVELDLPNVAQENVQIELKGNELRVFGEYRARERKRRGVLRQQGRRVGEFEFVITLPGDVEAERVEASLEHGVLRVWAPKAASGRSRRIEVHRGEEVSAQPTGQRPEEKAEHAS